MIFENILRLNFLDIVVLYAFLVVMQGITKAVLKAIKEGDDIRSGRQKTCGPCNFTVVTNEYSITAKIMDDHNERCHEGKPA